MEVPIQNAALLWQLPNDEFNEWRATNDLPLLLEFFRRKLPGFAEWQREFSIDANVFCRVVPTGHLFRGIGETEVVESRQPEERFTLFQPVRPSSLGAQVSLPDGSAPRVVGFQPYFDWAKNRLAGRRYFARGTSDHGKTDTFVYNLWRAPINAPQSSRAYLHQEFPVLKLGGVTIGSGVQIGGKNLDFADLDALTIEGEWHGSWEANVQFSSCQRLQLRGASLHHFRFQSCTLQGWRCVDSTLQHFEFIDCDGFDVQFQSSKLNRVAFTRVRFPLEFDECRLIDVEYVPPRQGDPASIADNYRRLRGAYQRDALRQEASRSYYSERKYERKALAHPYLRNRELFPPMMYAGTIRNVWEHWASGDFTGNRALGFVGSVIMFHIKTWSIPKYAFRAARFKIRYTASLAESILWGYGERPARIFLNAIGIVAIYAGSYYMHRGELTHFPAEAPIVNSIYFSLVTFTTLGYGDILPGDTLMKLVCGSEALIGAFVVGLVVAGFANRSRY